MTHEQQKKQNAQWSIDQIEHYFSAIKDVTDLRIFVLVRHVAFEEWLRTVLARRLDTDTLPYISSFAVLSGLALAGSGLAAARRSVGLFNEARNQIA